MLVDVRRLASSSASSSRDLVVEASSQVQGARSASRSFASSSRGPDSPAAGQEASKHGSERILPLAQVTRAAPLVVKIKRKNLSVGTRLGLGARILYLGFPTTRTIPRI